MRLRQPLFAATVCALCLAVHACKTNDIDESNTTNNITNVGVGAQGGTITGPDGTSLRVPAGALAKDVPLSIEVATGDYPLVPGGFTFRGKVYSFLPAGTTFLEPVVVSLPAKGITGYISGLQATGDGKWSNVATETVGDAAEITTKSLSLFTLVTRWEDPIACASRVPDPAAPTGNAAALSGWCDVDWSDMSDGYATMSKDRVTVYFSPLTNLCGRAQQGLVDWNVPMRQLVVSPKSGVVAPGKFSGDEIGAGAVALADGMDHCIFPPAVALGSQEGAVWINEIKDGRVWAQFDFVPTPRPGFPAKAISGYFDVPICEAVAGLDPPYCCGY
jgi:hypothetical protein